MRSRMPLPAIQLQYNLTRNFRWSWFGPVSLLGGFTVFAFLIVINSKPTPCSCDFLQPESNIYSLIDWIRNCGNLSR